MDHKANSNVGNKRAQANVNLFNLEKYIHNEDWIILSIYTTSNTASKSMRQKWQEIQDKQKHP